jgi:ferric-dicitrate binding protein FerR (iron transport regulator)
LATYKHIASLIIKYRNNELSDKEKKELEEWCALSKKNQMLFDRLNDEAYLSLKRKRLNSIDIDAQWEKITARLPVRKKTPWQILIRQWKVAAIVISLIGAGVLLYWLNQPSGTKPGTVSQTTPGEQEKKKDALASKRIVLTLADGKLVYLDGKADGQVARQQNAIISKVGDWLKYTWENGKGPAGTEYNTITTPKGKDLKLELPDGSKVWLNAASSITYPTAFTGNERTVKITGEAYFEVARKLANPAKREGPGNNIPFFVDMPAEAGLSGGLVEVLGTHFNVNAYSEEGMIKTTLVEGKVKMSSTGNGKARILKPGEQARLGVTGELKVVKNVNTEETVAWTKGRFNYDEQDIKLIMRDIARWYDYEVEFKGEVNGYYTFKISKRAPIEDVLKVLEAMGEMHFRIEGKQIIVTSSQG